MNLTEKYRPTELEQVIGHKEVIKSLMKFVESKSIPHTLMLSGENGIGKTTIARIIANKLDAEIIELDGATFGKIEVMRDIQENISTFSLFKPNKVYIIDECHGLSKQAFDSLLKTIENPPSHIYFIFCTTEPDKVVKGVLQRCIHYKLQPVNSSDIKTFLKFIINSENMHVPDDVINLVVVESKGSPRQAINLLVKVKDVDFDEAQILINTSFEKKEVYDLCRNIVKKESFMKAIKILEQLKDLNPYSIRLQILNYLNACVFKARNEREVANFLTMLYAFEKARDSISAIIIAIGEIYFEVKDV